MQFSPEELDVLARFKPAKSNLWLEPSRQFVAHAVLDHGGRPALGEVRLGPASEGCTALEDACRLARSASIRAGLLGLFAGGAAVVVVAHPELDPEMVVSVLRDRLAASPLRVVAGQGLHDVAASLGEPVLDDPAGLARLRGRVLEACLGPVLAEAAEPSVLVLDAGPVGRDAAASLVTQGRRVAVWDEDPARAEQLAATVGADVHRGPWLEAEVDVLVPCGPRPVLDAEAADGLAARAVCGLASRVFVDDACRSALEARGRRVVPEILAATAEPLALALAQGLLDEDTALTSLEQTAARVLAEPRGARERAMTLAIERSKAAG